MGNSKTRVAPNQTEERWVRFKKDGDEESRNWLLERYLPIVHSTAARLCAKLPSSVEQDDLVSAGTFGLISAIKAFDLRRRVKFETYCARRIRGAMLDELRTMDWVPRLVRERAHRLAETAQAMEARLGRRCTEEELARAMKMSVSEFRKLQRHIRAASPVSLSRKWFETDSNRDVCQADLMADKRTRDPMPAVLRSEIREFVTHSLGRTERLVATLYYFEGMTMKEISEVLGLSEGRICQIHASILSHLSAQLG